MNDHKFPPGQVAMVRPYLKREWSLVGILTDAGSWATKEGTFAVHVDDVRPLVTLDLDDAAASFVRVLREGAYNEEDVDRYDSLANQIAAQLKPPRIPEPTGPLAEVEASTRGRERRRLVRGLERGGGGHDVRWVDGVSSWSWHELTDPKLVTR